ncbi:sigma 54-interacting transcriptional regulator [Lewinella sp. IMCC34191]|uniref:sigma 54-interacting transcriptional regulator n=1 Tax=Lewinella sp. IMCC34191 TaxID=2259172 RepID=UPI000E234F00|nr:sigma 54-interacting transcriptional regulator [Lewinella sp. IMCC34191]
MPDSAFSSSTVPPPIAEWVRANPLPTQLLGGEGEPLLANAAYAELLRQLGSRGDDMLAQLLAAPSETALTQRAWLATLRPGECLVRQLRPVGNQRYTFHLVKLALSEGNYLCCMLMPGEYPAEAHLSGILNAIPFFVLEFDAVGKVSYLNDPLREHLGYALRDVRRPGHLRQLLDGFRAEELQHRLAEVGERGRVHFRGTLIRQDGTTLPMEMSIGAGQVPNERLYLLTARDVGAQLAYEATLNAALAAAEREAQASAGEIRDLRVRLKRQAGDTDLAYRSEAFGAVLNRIRDLADLDVPVLVTGEAGSGKRFIARQIHRLSRRAERRLITVDCAVLPPALVGGELFGDQTTPGGLVAGDGGTLVLNAVEKLPLPVQARLAHVLREGKWTSVDGEETFTVAVRVLCTTSGDLKARVKAGSFSADLFHRLSGARVAAIPLRERREDIALLIGHFLQRYNAQFDREISGVDATTLQRLEAYSFPGNVRELQTLVERAFTTAHEGPPPLAPEVPAVGDPRTEALPVLDLFDGTLTEFVSFEAYQRKYIQLVLASTGGKVSGSGGAAEILQMHPQTLFSKLRKLGIRR